MFALLCMSSKVDQRLNVFFLGSKGKGSCVILGHRQYFIAVLTCYGCTDIRVTVLAVWVLLLQWMHSHTDNGRYSSEDHDCSGVVRLSWRTHICWNVLGQYSQYCTPPQDSFKWFKYQYFLSSYFLFITEPNIEVFFFLWNTWKYQYQVSSLSSNFNAFRLI